jgi:hypothetical protein
MKTIYETKLIKETPIAKKRKPSFQRLFKRQYKELKEEIEDYKKVGWTFTIVHRGKNQHLQYLIRQKRVAGKHVTVSMRAHNWEDLNKKLWFKAQQDVNEDCWAGYELTPSELETLLWIRDYTMKRRQIDPSPLLEKYRKKLRMRYDSKTRTCYISPYLPIRKRKNILKAAHRAILRAANIVKHRIE